MEEETQSPEEETPQSLQGNEYPPVEIQQMDNPEISNGSKRPSTLLIVGFLVVLALIITGLFLPPISLGKRLGLGNNETAGITETPTIVDTEQTIRPEGITLSAGSGLDNALIASYSPAQFSTNSEWATAAAAIPTYMTLKSSVYTIENEGGSLAGQAAIQIPADAGDHIRLDLYGWNGDEWAFIPSQIDPNTQQIVTAGGSLPQTLAIMETAAPETLAVGAEILPTQELPSDILPLLTEVSVGTLTLAGDGGLLGEASPIVNAPYEQMLRATNTGAIIDQTSLSALLNDPTVQTNHINILVGQAMAVGYAGVNLDYQGVPAEQADAYSKFVGALADALHSQGLKLVVTLATPQTDNDNWVSGGQQWSVLGQLADTLYIQMPLNPVSFGDEGMAEQLLSWATRQIPRHKITMLVTANAVDKIGESYLESSNQQALSNFGELQFVQGSSEIEPGSSIEVALSGTAGPLEWDGTSLTYKYTYQLSNQTHQVWLGGEAALTHRLRFSNRYNIRGISIRGLGNVAEGARYATTLANYLGTADAPQPVGAAIVWTIRSEEGSVIASSSGDTLSFSWEGTEDPGNYSVNADFALGDNVASLGSLEVAVIPPIEEEPVAEEEEEIAEAEPTPAPTTTPTPAPVTGPGDADAIVNVNANVRVGPGLTYGTIAGGLNAGSKVSVIGRNSDASWIQILMPDGETKGWIFATLITINSSINVTALEVIQVDPPVVAGGNEPPPPPANVPPVTNSGFELGGQTHSFANPTLMSYAGMNWVKFQHKWSAGDSPDAIAGRIQQAHANGFKVLLSIPGANHSSIDYNAYASFLGGVAALGPDAIEVWNEMNIDREWPAGQISPSTYVNSMLAPAYNAIKAANRNVMVISGAPAPTGFFGGCGGGGCNDDLYMAGIANAGGANYMDCIGIHYNEGIISPNQTSGDPRNPSNHYTRYFWGMVNTYWNAFGGSRPLCFTELGYLTGVDYGGVPGGFAWAGSTSIAQHAQWLAEATSLSASSGKVRLMIVFNVDFTHYSADPQAGYAMIRKDGGCPACETLRQVMGGG